MGKLIWYKLIPDRPAWEWFKHLNVVSCNKASLLLLLSASSFYPRKELSWIFDWQHLTQGLGVWYWLGKGRRGRQSKGSFLALPGNLNNESRAFKQISTLFYFSRISQEITKSEKKKNISGALPKLNPELWDCNA